MRWFWLALALLVCPAQAQVQFCGQSKTPCWTTGGRPSAPGIGTFGFNRTLNGMEGWNGTSWAITTAPGSAASPVIAIGGATQGLYEVVGTTICASCSNGVGTASNAKVASSINYRLDTSGGVNADNVFFKLGTGQAIGARSGADTYVATIATPSVTQTGNSQYIGFNIGSVGVQATDTVTKASQNAMLEMDKIDFTQSGGAVTYTNVVNTRFRFHFAHAGITFTNSLGIDFVPPAPLGGDQGTITNYIAINIPNMNAAGGYSGTNFYGMLFQGSMANGSIASVGGANLTLIAGSTGGGASDMILDALGGGRTTLRVAGLKVLDVVGSGSQQNYIQLDANNTPAFRVQSAGGTANVSFALVSKGSGSIGLFTGGGEQFRVSDTATAVNYVQINGGATGAPGVVTVSGIGTDADISIALVPKGAGTLKAGGTNALSKTYNVRAAGGAGDCTIIVVYGLATGGTC